MANFVIALIDVSSSARDTKSRQLLLLLDQGNERILRRSFKSLLLQLNRSLTDRCDRQSEARHRSAVVTRQCRPLPDNT